MQVQEVKFDPKWIAGPATDNDAPRSPGLHLSQIYGDLQAAFESRDEMEQDTLDTFRCGGFLWERIFEQAFAASIRSGNLVRPGEFLVEGIIGSPDNLDISNPEEWVVVDTKCTWKSVRKWDALEKYFWVWIVQLKGYCRMVGTKKARLVALFINGNYKGSGPTIKACDITFSQLEIEENWNMLKSHARKKGWLK